MEPLGLDPVIKSRVVLGVKRPFSFRKLGKLHSSKQVKLGSLNPLVPKSLPSSTSSSSIPKQRKIGSIRRFRLSSMARSLSRRGFDDRAIRLINNDHKPSTRNQYQGVWSKFLDYLKEQDIPQTDINEVVVANFLAFHAVVFERAYRTIAVYKNALADPLWFLFSISLDVRVIQKLLRGLFRLRPPPRDGRMPRWSLSVVLAFLRGPPFEPLETASWKYLLQKVLVLFLLGTGRRISEVSEIHRVAGIKGNTVYLRWLPGFSAKWESDRFIAKEPTLSKLVPFKSGDELLCPVRA